MVKLDTKQNILWQYLVWQFFEVLKNILRGWKNFLIFNLNYFSIFLLIRTFFSPWRRYVWAYPRGFDIGRYLETFISNLISRILGAVMRVFLIFFGILTEIFIFFAGLIVILVWLALPIILIKGIIFGFEILF